MEEGSTYCVSGVLFDGGKWYLWCIRQVVESFVVGGFVVKVVEIRWMSYVYGSKCESRCLFSCLHLDRISDFLFIRVICDGWVIIATFLLRQRRHFLMSCCRWVKVSQVIVGEMFMSFRCYMCVDKEEPVE